MKHPPMQRPLTFAALACALAACTPSNAPERSGGAPVTGDTPASRTPATPVDATATRLTVYSGDYESLANAMPPQAGMPGYALVERPLHFDLKSGRNDLREAALPPSMDASAATLRAQSPGVTIEGQRYHTALSGTQDALAQSIGRKVTVEHTSGGAMRCRSRLIIFLKRRALSSVSL